MPYGATAHDLASSRACSMKTCATELSVRFFRVTIPVRTRAFGSAIGKTLSAGRLLGNFNADAGKIVTKRPVASRYALRSAPG